VVLTIPDEEESPSRTDDVEELSALEVDTGSVVTLPPVEVPFVSPVESPSGSMTATDGPHPASAAINHKTPDLRQFNPTTVSRYHTRVLAWETLGKSTAPDGVELELRRRGREFLIRAGGYDLMSSDDEGSSRALADLGLKALARPAKHVLVGGLGMGYTLRAALDAVGPDAIVEVAELVPAVVEWNRNVLADVAGRPLEDRRARVFEGNVLDRIGQAKGTLDAILLDVDNGPDALAHDGNEAIYAKTGLDRARAALKPGGVLGVWSFSDDAAFTRRCRRAGFETRVERVPASRKGRGRHHFIWLGVRG